MAKIYIMIYFLISVNTIYEFWYKKQYKKKPKKNCQHHPQQHLYLQTNKKNVFAKSMKPPIKLYNILEIKTVQINECSPFFSELSLTLSIITYF